MIGQTISHYKILEELGAGGMGVVYKAEDTKLKRTVALKFLSPQSLGSKQEQSRFIHEAQAAAALNHPNICTIYEIDERQGQSFIAMECVEGESLRTKIESGPLKLDDAIGIIMQVSEGLQVAHEKGIVHRDIKAANIMVTSAGQAKIMDFGLARAAGMTKLTKTGTTVGTLVYMSPEQARGEDVDHRTDIWALGIVLYEMLTGQVPFRSDYEQAVVYSILNEAPEPITALRTGVPMEVERVVGKALEKEPGRRYQRVEELLVDLRNLRDDVAPGRVAIRASSKSRRRFLAVALVLLVVAVSLLFGIRIQIGREPPPMAAENKLAVMYFENMADPEDTGRIGDIVTNLLIADLSESRYVQILSSQRLYDILKQLGKEGTKKVDRDIASQVAGKANAKWMLLGNILQVEPQIVLMAQLVEVATGNAIASQRITGDTGENIFSVVDKLTVEVKKDLSLPPDAQKEEDPRVADVTTNSSEAYRYYLEGVEYAAKYYFTEAEKSFRKALEFDSTFAMVYLKLANYEDEWKEMVDKAVAYSDKVSKKEKHYIRSAEALASENQTGYVKELKKMVELYPDEKEVFYKLGRHYVYSQKQYEEAAGYFGKAIEIDPLYKLAYNELAYIYNKIGNFEKSIWAINKYISIAPDEANPYDTRGDLYAVNGKIDQAIVSFKKALEIKPDFYMSLAKLGHMYLFKREYAKAESRYNKLFTSPDRNLRSWGRTCLAFIPLYQGKFEQALKVLDDGIAADRMEKYEGWDNSNKHFLKARIYEEKKNLDLALEETKKSIEISLKQDPNDILNWQDHYAYLLVENGDVTTGEEILNNLKRDIEEEEPNNEWNWNYYWYGAGRIELAKGNLATAISHFDKAAISGQRFDVLFFLSSIYLQLGRLGDAVAELEKGLLRYNWVRAQNSIYAVKANYLLGVAYERSGWNKKAIEQYEEFLDLWKNADPGIEEIDDANARLARLTDT